MAPSDYEDKIAKLLTKAEGRGVSPEEAEALTAAAERLMIKYSITRAMVESKKAASGEKREEIVTRRMTFEGEYRNAYLSMGSYVANALGLKTYTYGGDDNLFRKSGKPLFIVGFESDVEAAVTLIASLQLQCAVAFRTWNKTQGKPVNQGARSRRRNDYTSSFGAGAARRIRESRAVAERDAESETPGTALVLRSKAQSLDDYWNSLSMKAGKASRRRTDYSAYSAGYNDGQKANTGDTQVGESRRSLSGS